MCVIFDPDKDDVSIKLAFIRFLKAILILNFKQFEFIGLTLIAFKPMRRMLTQTSVSNN